MSVEFKAKNLELLKKALAQLGWRYASLGPTTIVIGDISINLKTEKATIPTSAQGRLNELKRAYSYQAVKLSAASKGWTIQGNTTKGQMVKY